MAKNLQSENIKCSLEALKSFTKAKHIILETIHLIDVYWSISI